MKFSFLSPKFIEHSVGDEVLKFYAVRVATAGKLRGFLKPVFRGLAQINAGGANDIGKESTETADKDGFRQLRTELKSITPELAKVRSEQREKAIDDLVDALLQEASMRCIGILILDCLRAPNSEKDAQELVDNTDLGTLFELIKGVAKANKEVFGPLTDRVEEVISTLKRASMKRVPDDEPESGAASASDSPKEPLEETPKTSSSPTSNEP